MPWIAIRPLIRRLPTCAAPSHGDMRAARVKRATRRGGRAAEGARLESVYAGNCIAGSNPAPSATIDTKSLFYNGLLADVEGRSKHAGPEPRRGFIFPGVPLSTAREPRARPAREFACAPCRPQQCAILRLRVPRCDKRHSVRVNEPVRREGWKSGEPRCLRRFHAIPPKPWFKPLSL